MPREGGDEARLWDMLDAARAIAAFTAGVGMDAYLSDDLLQAAVERKVELIGEAARQVSEEFRESHPTCHGARSLPSGTYLPTSTARSGRT